MPCLRDASTPTAPHAASAHLERFRPLALLRVASGVAMAAVLAVSFGAGTACSTRATTPTVGPDSTLVYSSRIPGDVQASITFTLKDSKRREEQRRLERERQRQLERERKEREAKERAERAKARAEAKRKKAAVTTTKKPTKKPAKKQAKKQDATAVAPAKSPSPSKTPPAVEAATPDTAVANLPAVPDTAGADSIQAPPTAKTPSLPPDERVFELEEGARVQAYVKIANPYGRGKRPVMFHTVWLNPEGKRVFKRMTEWAPNDTSQVITTSLTISPAKRTAGRYTLRVYLFRELIAEKSIELTGVSTAAKEADERSGM